MNFDQVTRTFLDFYRERGHRLLTGSSLVPPPGDPVLFTSAGMQPLTPYLLGRPHPDGRRLTGVQRCLRTTDLEEVGDPTHLTVFEMLGSWSLGDYSGEQSVRWGYELLRDGFGIRPDRLHATVFGGDQQVRPDQRSVETWQRLGVPVELTREENWWSNGPTGPCGPDTEIFVRTGDGGSMELWNHVMMRYHRGDDGSLRPLSQSNVDTGLGLERLLMLLQGKTSVYECDIFQPWLRTVPPLWRLDVRPLRLVCDHLRSGIVVAGDGVRPSNTGRGYVLRRLIRRVLTVLWREDPARTLGDLPDELLDHTLDHFRQPADRGEVRGVLLDEQRRFQRLVERGPRAVSRRRSRGPLREEDFRDLHDTHGLPRDLVVELLSGEGGTGYSGKLAK